MEKWKEIMSKCSDWKKKESCVIDGKPCSKLNTCKIRQEYNDFISAGGEKKEQERKEFIPTICPRLSNSENLILCKKNKCEWYVKLPALYPKPDPDPCCAVVAFVEAITQLRIVVEGIKATQENKLT